MSVTISCDTGATQPLMFEMLLTFSDFFLSDVLCWEKKLCPERHTVFLHLLLVTRLVQIGLLPKVPMWKVAVIFGNDLAGKRFSQTWR